MFGMMVQKIDIAVAPLSMTAAKAELVDFVTPYFENSGLSIGNIICRWSVVIDGSSGLLYKCEYCCSDEKTGS